LEDWSAVRAANSIFPGLAVNTTPSQPKLGFQPPDPATLIACAWRYKWIALLLGVLFAALGATAAHVVVPARFKATSMVRVSGANWVVDRRGESATESRQFRTTQLELLETPHVLRRALESPQVRDLGVLDTSSDSIDELQRIMQVELRSNSEILRIAVEHDRADVAFFLANAVTEAYLIETTRESEEAQAKRLAVLEQLHASTEERLSNAWVEFRQLARQLGSGDLGALSLQAQAEIENYRDANRRLREVRAEKREIEREVRLIRESPELVTAEIPDEGTSSIRYALFQAKLRKEHALSKWGPNHPEVRAAQQNEDLFLEFYQKALLKDEEQQEQRPKKTREEEVLAEPLAALARITAEEQALETMIEEIDQRVQLLGGDSIPRLEVIRNGINRMERLSDRIWNTREDSSVERHADNRVQLVAYASLPSQPDTSKRKKISLALAAGGFGFAFVLLAMGEFLTGRLHSAREATQRTGLTVLASLPRLPVEVRNSPEVRTLHVRSNPLNTQMDMLVAQLRHNPNAPDPRTILVTCSRWPREREHVAVHLAAALARTGQRTVFVNFNLRSQPAHVVFPNAIAEIATTPTDQVTGDASSSGDSGDDGRRIENVTLDALREANSVMGNGRGTSFAFPVESHQTARVESRRRRAVSACNPFPADMPLVGTGVANLDLLQPTRVTTEPLPVFAHPELPELLEALNDLYAYVVLEVPEVLDYPDAMHLGRLADVSLLAVQRNRSVAYSVAKALSKLAQHGRPVFGVMID
jgi:Mrp family chromosome partitioning ATPase/capsular polysaccharide biosynthesis protein